jgi:hypothetical protein
LLKRELPYLLVSAFHLQPRPLFGFQGILEGGAENRDLRRLQLGLQNLAAID